jgi:hypothetical protein
LRSFVRRLTAMLLEWSDYYSLIFLAPFLALEFFWRARR